MKSEGCSVTITIVYSKEPRNNPDLVTSQFSLTDLDTTIKIETNWFGQDASESDGAIVHLDIRDQRNLIHVENGNTWSGVFLDFYHKDDAERFARALRHAVILRGGKASKF